MYPSLVELYLTTWRINTRPTYLFVVVSHLEDDDCKITFGFPWTSLSYSTYFDAFTHVFLEMLAHVSRVHYSCAHVSRVHSLMHFYTLFVKKKISLESRNLRNHSASTVVACQTSKPRDKAILNVGCKNDLSENM